MPPTSETPTNSNKSRNTLLVLLIVLVVALLGIMIGLLAFLLTSRNNNQVLTTNSSSSSSSYSTSTNSLTSVSSSSSLSTNSTESATLSSTTSSSSVSFSHNEGRFIRFDYPTGWKVDVTSTKSDGTFSSFDDIMQVKISENNGIEISLNFQGGFGCGPTSYDYVNFNVHKEMVHTEYDPTSLQNTTYNFRINRFEATKLNLRNSKETYLADIKFDYSTDLPKSWVNEFRNTMYLKDGNLVLFECGGVDLDKMNYTSSGTLLDYYFPDIDNNDLTTSDLTQIIERFTNSFQKK